MNNIKLKTAAVMVSLKVSSWTGKKLDRKASLSVNDQYQAKDAGKFNKYLIEPHYLAAIQTKIGEIRRFHHKNTLSGLPGIGILPNKNYFHYTKQMSEYKMDFFGLVQQFLDKYPQAVQDAHIQLGKLFKEEDYPLPFEVESKFSLDIQILPLPEDLNWAESLGIEADYDGVTPIVESAAKEQWIRLNHAIKTLYERLNTPDSRVHQTLVDNLVELTEILPRLNFTQDPELDKLASDTKKQVANLNLKSIRSDDSEKRAAAQDVKGILDKVKAYI